MRFFLYPISSVDWVAEEADVDDTREFDEIPTSARFDNLQFGKDYEIK